MYATEQEYKTGQKLLGQFFKKRILIIKEVVSSNSSVFSRTSLF